MKFHTTSINNLLLLLLHIIPATAVAAATLPAYSPADRILLNCGASASGFFDETSHRSWATDAESRFMPANATAISLSSTASNMDPNVSPVPYQAARVFTNSFTYTFPISTGQNSSASTSTPTSIPTMTLLNLSSQIHHQYQDGSEKLALTFSPEPSSTGFVNGIEIVSIPDELYLHRNDSIKHVGENTRIFYLGNNSALETLYRLNVGGGRVNIEDDSGMYRSWYPDDGYLIGQAFGYTQTGNFEVKATVPYTAPDIVYASARMTYNTSSLNWEFPVDSGFNYLVRLHFCEFTQGVTKSGQRTFSILLNNIAADIAADVVSWAGSPLIPTIKDYIIWLPDYHDDRGKHNLGMSLFPDSAKDQQYRNAFLNGLEIFKLNRTNGSLASANPEPPVKSFELTVKPKQGKKSRRLFVIFGSLVGVLAVAGVSTLLIHRRLHKAKKPSYGSAAESSFQPSSTTSTPTTSTTAADSQPWKSCRYFSLAEIRAATSNLDRNSIIGRGGFGCVYMGVIDDGAITVAIKRLNPSSNQGAREFLTEIHMLSKLRHLHLVSLIGYCDEDGKMILVYDYMAHGSLHDHLYSSHKPPLSWKLCLHISMGAAKGLHYLHTGAEHAVIHRDVKSTNILLDHNWVAKISDFGLSKMGESNDSFTHISTNVKGTFGYLDPKYLSTHQLTRKSDVYAFGVVLFELLSGRAAVDVRLDEEQHSLAGWARFCVREGRVDELIHSNLEGQISAGCLDVFVGIAGRCIHIQPLERPTMADVVMGLELAATLQETTVVEDDDNDAGGIHSDRSQVVVSMDVICGTDCS
ncbi:receptor-like protein kinase FERONIA [Salvia divinorum]|uniref:Receptor-like protein kinase FERONIA n=1 Tax=Salvia divinorum TaxID=28513 RepID=A0ABD1G6X2_SALDI